MECRLTSSRERDVSRAGLLCNVYRSFQRGLFLNLSPGGHCQRVILSPTCGASPPRRLLIGGSQGQPEFNKPPEKWLPDPALGRRPAGDFGQVALFSPEGMFSPDVSGGHT